MIYKLVIKPKAELEIRKAQSWYEGEQSNLGISFIESLDELLVQVAKNPTTFAIKYRNFRMGLTNRFPYAIHYIMEPNQVVILAVLHTKRKPRK